MTDLLQHDLTFRAAPRISQALFVRVLGRNMSPAAVEAAVCYHIPPVYGLDPALALAFFHHESSYGTQGVALATRNWGNLRRGQGRSTGMLRGFATYRTWADSLHDWCTLIANVYVGSRRLVTVRPALQVYAPTSDGNAPKRYADAVMADVARWMAEDTLPEVGTHYRVRADVTTTVRIRSAARTNASVLGELRAGDDWWGEAFTAKVVTTVKGFGSSKVWVRSADMRFVWANLLQEVKS
jgi:hypothetical protein